MAYKGSCLCGSIRYEIDHINPGIAHCHCSMCRKFHGAAFATFAVADASSFRWLAGEDQLASFTADNGTTRRFCKACGTSLTFAPSTGSGGKVEIALGTLDDPVPNRPESHIYTNWKADWHQITDDLPRHKEGRE